MSDEWLQPLINSIHLSKCDTNNDSTAKMLEIYEGKIILQTIIFDITSKWYV